MSEAAAAAEEMPLVALDVMDGPARACPFSQFPVPTLSPSVDFVVGTTTTEEHGRKKQQLQSLVGTQRRRVSRGFYLFCFFFLAFTGSLFDSTGFDLALI